MMTVLVVFCVMMWFTIALIGGYIMTRDIFERWGK